MNNSQGQKEACPTGVTHRAFKYAYQLKIALGSGEGNAVAPTRSRAGPGAARREGLGNERRLLLALGCGR